MEMHILSEIRKTLYKDSGLVKKQDKETKAVVETEEVRRRNFLKTVADHDARVVKQQAEALEEEAKRQSRLLEIASKIMKGERVSPEEERELAMSSPELYALAKQARELSDESGDKNTADCTENEKIRQKDEEQPEKENEEWTEKS